MPARVRQVPEASVPVFEVSSKSEIGGRSVCYDVIEDHPGVLARSGDGHVHPAARGSG